MGFLKWLFEPIKDMVDEFRADAPVVNEVEQDPTTEQPIKYHISTPPTLFRPTTFDEYIGQDKAKSILKAYIQGVKHRKTIFPHILIHGKAGTGKTTLAKIVANELSVQLIEIITASITKFWKLQMLIQNNAGQVIFLDEIHALDRSTAENLYTVMEDFTYNGKELPRFTLAGATTELGEMLKDRRPFCDRFKIIIELEDYSTNDIITIIEQYQNKIFTQEQLKFEELEIIAVNCRTIPRMAIRLLEATIYMGNVKKVLENFGIIQEGYTLQDLKVLKYMLTNTKGVGLQSISSYLGTSNENYMYQIEPYLLQTGLISRTPRGRKITEKGVEKIKELDNVVQLSD
jgi:Holliday junction DNA helicase RuvB